MSNDLKPCPFCGGEAAISEMDEPWAYISCALCNISFSIYDVYSEMDATEAWNRRV